MGSKIRVNWEAIGHNSQKKIVETAMQVILQSLKVDLMYRLTYMLICPNS